MYAAMLVFGLMTGIPDWQAVTLASAHTFQTLLVVFLLRRYLPDMWGCGGDKPLASTRMLAVYLACIGVGVVVSAVPVTSVWLAAGDPDTAAGHAAVDRAEPVRRPAGHHRGPAAVPAPLPAPAARTARGRAAGSSSSPPA